MISILISSHNRESLFRRTLHSIMRNKPREEFEVVVVDDGSDFDVEMMMRRFSSVFPWVLVKVSREKFEEETGIDIFFNNPSWTNNVAWKHSRGNILCLQGNEILATANSNGKSVYNEMREFLEEAREEGRQATVYSTTFDVRLHLLEKLDMWGSNLHGKFEQDFINECSAWPLQTKHLFAGVTNYLSMTPREVWEALGGYDERYLAGIACEDSDFSRRAGWHGVEPLISFGVSLHQDHKGTNRYRKSDPSIITGDRWEEGLAINRAHFESLTAGRNIRNSQPWEPGTVGILSVVRS